MDSAKPWVRKDLHCNFKVENSKWREAKPELELILAERWEPRTGTPVNYNETEHQIWSSELLGCVQLKK